ncbi:unnamed protein product [Adineta ricciae]|uniref:Tudor domain-containing protein n=1 Tax=Adineta ricciae TaxID=249248 RepID=A0A814QHA9_ADIRI|nr:unnamed protein product [Adineta ricciae]
MASASNVVKTIPSVNDDFFLCRAFASAISSDKLLEIIDQQPASSIEFNVSATDPVEMVNDSPLPVETDQWKVGDLCLCPYSEDNLLYKATIVTIDASSCTVSFDEYGNEEIHLLSDLQIRTDDDQQDILSPMEKQDVSTSVSLPIPAPPPPSLPPFPNLPSNEDNDSLSATLMSWYLAGYHTGFYQALKKS